MDLILREEVKLDCVSTGRQIEDAVLRSKEKLSDKRLEEIIEPLVHNITKRTQCHAEREVDEYMGYLDDKKEEENKEKIKQERISDLTEKAILYNEINKTSRHLDHNHAKRISNILDVELKNPINDPYDITYNDVVNYDSDDSYWNDYIHTININNNNINHYNDSTYMDLIIKGDTGSILKYVKKHSRDTVHMIELLEDIKKDHLIPYYWRLDDIIATTKVITDLRLPTRRSTRKRKRLEREEKEKEIKGEIKRSKN